MRKLFFLVISIIMIVASITTVFAFAETGSEGTPTSLEQVEIKTLPDLGTAKFAGTGAYYDDGMLKYAGSGNTIGYKGDYSNTLVEFDIVFDKLSFPAWFSLTFKASGFDRTQSSNLSQKGYSIAIFYNGKVEVWKPGLSETVGKISNFSVGTKYRVQVGAYNEGENVRIYLSVDGVEIINVLDQVNPYLTGSYFNICGDGGASARLFSTKKEVVPDYYTYTNSTMGCFPSTTASGVNYDKYKNVNVLGSSGTFGWGQKLRDFSFETKINWEKFGAGASFWCAMRAQKFDRVTSAQDGYRVRIGVNGSIDLYKDKTKMTSGKWKYIQDTDYIFEFGVVDLDENRTMVFVNVNGLPVATMIDNDQPLRRSGFIVFNGDGSIKCSLKSVNTKITPLLTAVSQDEQFYRIETYFNNTISYTDMCHDDFSSTLLEAIWVNNSSVKEWNDGYYYLDGAVKERAVNLEYVNNKLIITIAKTLYKNANNQQTQFSFAELMLKKTGDGKGMVCPTGYQLKQTYYFNV